MRSREQEARVTSRKKEEKHSEGISTPGRGRVTLGLRDLHVCVALYVQRGAWAGVITWLFGKGLAGCWASPGQQGAC